MMDIIRQSGPFGILICVLFLVNCVLVGLILTRLLGSGGAMSPVLKNRINTVLFWGGVGAVTGLLGQANGIYLASKMIASAASISPQVIIEGFGISFVSTMMGLVFLLVSALAWWVLRGMYVRRVGDGVPA